MNAPTTELHNSMTATYSPEDNKLRLYPSARLSAELYATVRAAGFIHAPKQGLYVAPMWTPEREELLLSLCDEIGDEDTSLVERAEQRAERFGDYQDSRANDAARARDTVAVLADCIPFGQPILVGHHSEARARKDASRIERGMQRAVALWDQSEYWKNRAAGALRHAKYKENPGVRARRIKGLEADKRKQERALTDSEKLLKGWESDSLTLERALYLANFDHFSRCYPLADFPRNAPASQYEGLMGLWSALDGCVIDHTQAQTIAITNHRAIVARALRWIAHYNNRLSYERAMLGEQVGFVADTVDYQAGGRVKIGSEWLTIIRVTKKDGKPVSVSTNARYGRVKAVGEVLQYEAPAPEAAAAVAKATKLAPICNYPGEGIQAMTKAEWDKVPKDYKGFKKREATETTGAHRVRHALGVYVLKGETDINKRHSYVVVYLSDDKRKDPTPAEGSPVSPAGIAPPARDADATPSKVYQPREQNEFDAMRDQLATGAVQVVTADQLFPTPQAVAERLVELAGVDAGHLVLEPEAGTGAILRALSRVLSLDEVDLHAVEINAALVARLRVDFPESTVTHGDFLQFRPLQGSPLFDRILMNPPFAGGQDIKHILHAVSLLAPGGRLTAICANGPRQNATLKAMVEGHGGTWELLPAGSFAPSGTNVPTVLLSLTAD